MNWMNIARVAKVVALLAFVLPWLAVSCNGTPLAEATGLDLVTGGVKAMNQEVSEDRTPQWWAIGTLALIGLGLALSFALKPARRAAAGLGGAAAAALALSAVGMMLMIGSFKSEFAEKMNEPNDPAANAIFDASEMQKAMAEAIRIDTKFGYWLELLALAGAAGAAFMAFSGRALPTMAAARTAGAPADPDSAYWDSIDKTDRAALEEYIYRFPDGRFVELARNRLAGTPPQA
jgi:hypothetical protein